MLCPIYDDSMAAEITQLEAYLHGDSLPTTTHDAFEDVDESAMDATVQAARANFIQSLRTEDEESYNRGDRFSRACHACDRDHPDSRVVSRACLHIVCGECAAFAYEECPICIVPTAFSPLLEDPRAPRACTSCYWPAPAERALLSACGHAVCRACAYTLSGQAEVSGEAVHCAMCHTPSDLIPLEEELIEDVDSITRRFACMEH